MSQFDSPIQPGQPNPGYDLGAGFKWAWEKFQKNAATLVIGTLIIIVASVAVAVVVQLVASSIFVTSPSLDTSTGRLTGGSGFIASILVSALASAIASIPLYLLAANLVRVALSIADGQSPEIGDFLKFEKVDKTLLVAVMLAAGTFIGTVLCYVPGFLFSIGASYTLYFLIDKNMEPLEAIKASFSFVLGNIGTLILVILASIAAMFVGFLACCIGILVAAPVILLLNANAFRSLNQGTVAP